MAGVYRELLGGGTVIYAVEFWWQRRQSLPLTVLVRALDGLDEVLAEALALEAPWDDPGAAVAAITARLSDIFNTWFVLGSQRQHHTFVVDFNDRRVTDVNDGYSSKGFKRWIRSYDL